MRVDLSSLLREIEIPVSKQGTDHRYFVKPIPNFERHYFGRTSSGAPSLLLSANDRSPRTPIRLAAVEVSFSVPCHIAVLGDQTTSETLTAISCTAGDRVLQGYFTHVCETLLHIVGASPSLDQIADAVQRLVDLFQKLSGPPRRTAIGLFGELFVIYSAKSTATAVQAWRSTTDDRFDFSIARTRLEVKASGTRQRAHDFSLEQCLPPADSVGVLVSLFAEASGGGLSLLDLIERIELRLGGDPGLQLKLQETIAESLGQTAAAAFSMRFDEDVARSSLRIYELGSIPAVRGKLPSEVSQVRFRSDLSRVTPADRDTLANQNAHLDNILPPER